MQITLKYLNKDDGLAMDLEKQEIIGLKSSENVFFLTRPN